MIYARVGANDIWRIDLSVGSPLLTWPGASLHSRYDVSDWVCSAMDLRLTVSDRGVSEGLIAKSISKLTPEEAAALPPPLRP